MQLSPIPSNQSIYNDYGHALLNIDRYGLSIKDAHSDLRTDYNVLMITLDSNGLIISFINEYDFDLACLAVRSRPIALSYIPEEWRTIKTIQQFLFQNMEYLCEHHDTLNIDELKALVQFNGFALKYIKHDEQTNQLIESALKNNPLAIQYANKHIITPKQAHYAVSRDGSLLEYIHKKLITVELSIIAIKYNSRMILYATDKFNKKIVIAYCNNRYNTTTDLKRLISRNFSARDVKTQAEITLHFKCRF